ncbi:uncharacterized protein LOC143856010 [Tasmannia lanceolata]|uniref:uncharacterized protein LOC143856010 n=1 Tax=Tasmannia lanceolata TaxID=3420 RepID=UPI004063AF36
MEYKLNADASLVRNGGGIGGLIRDSNGMVIKAFSVNIPKEEIFELELEAIMNGVNLVTDMGASMLWIESDSSFAVDVIQGKTAPPGHKAARIGGLFHSLNNLDSWRISHCWREGNQIADFLSKHDCLCKGSDINPLMIPPNLLEILYSDRDGKVYTRK